MTKSIVENGPQAEGKTPDQGKARNEKGTYGEAEPRLTSSGKAVTRNAQIIGCGSACAAALWGFVDRSNYSSR